jgi:inner membrane protein
VDNLTHTLLALTIGRAGLERLGAGATATLVVASNIPDIEVLTRLNGDRLAYLAAHRGPTHGPLGLLLGVATAAAVWGVVRWRAGRSAGPPPASLGLLCLVGLLGIVGHVAFDLPTSYGTRLLSPWSGAWFGTDWMPIVDVYLLAGLIAAQWIGWQRPSLRRAAALLLLALVPLDVMGRAVLHQRALDLALQRHVQWSGERVPRPSTFFRYAGPERPAALPAAIPTIRSPFHWRLITKAPGGFAVSEVNLLSEADRTPPALPGSNAPPRDVEGLIWFPDDRGPLVERAAGARFATVFLQFSRFPAAEIRPNRNGDVTVHWYDLRFAARIAPRGEDRRRHTSPFGAWVRLSPSGAVVAQLLGPG